MENFFVIAKIYLYWAFIKIHTYRRIFDKNKEAAEEAQNGEQEEGEPGWPQTIQMQTVPSFCCSHASAFDEYTWSFQAGGQAGQGARGTGVSID